MKKNRTPVMKIRNLTKKYGDVIGIKDLDLDIYKGEIMGFLGPNGAGKTTTIRACLGLLNKTAGDVKIFGLDSHKDSLEIYRRTGYLPGDFGMYPDLKVKTILKFLLSQSGVSDETKMMKLAKRLELDMGKKYGNLSKGNKQKVGIVQAFMADQDLIIMDEPTTGLDPLMQQKFYRLLREERDNGKTIFMSSHILAEVEEVCDRVAIIRSDMMIPHGTEILHPGPDLSDPTDLIEHLMETSTSMPYQVLTGTQAGAVTGSETNLLIYYIEVNKRRRGKINDMLMDKLEYLQKKGALPEGEFELDWGDVLPPDHKEEAGILSKTAVAVERLYEAGVISEEEARDMLGEMTG